MKYNRNDDLFSILWLSLSYSNDKLNC